MIVHVVPASPVEITRTAATVQFAAPAPVVGVPLTLALPLAVAPAAAVMLKATVNDPESRVISRRLSPRSPTRVSTV